MFSLKNRVLVVASSLETNGTEAFSQHGSLNADRMLLDTFMDKPDQTQVQYKMVFFFASVSDTNGFIDLKLLKKFYGAVASGGTISFHLALPKEDTDAVVQRFNKYATYSGFVNPQITRDEQSPESRRLIQLIAQKPSWSSGDGACLSLKPAAQEELIDESSLIDSTEVYVPMGKGKSDCASKPRACANCTCGRKELEVQLGAEEAKERLESAAVRSSCGNCYLGDAFRCSGCPYKGLPAFKPGEKVQLDLVASGTLFTHTIEIKTPIFDDRYKKRAEGGVVPFLVVAVEVD